MLKTIQTKSFHEFWEKLKHHDWKYIMSDFNTEYRKGKEEREKINKIVESKGGAYKIAYDMWDEEASKLITSNKKVRVIKGYFIDKIKELEGIPVITDQAC